jgi:hypothetical protein
MCLAKGCAIPLESLCSTLTCAELHSMLLSSPPQLGGGVKCSKDILELGNHYLPSYGYL